MSVKIVSTGSFLGDNAVTNVHLYSLIKNFDPNRAKETVQKKGNNVEGLTDDVLFDLWVKQVCGVEQRYYFNEEISNSPDHPLQRTEYMGFRAGKKAIENAGVSPSSIEHVIFCSYTPDQIMPNPACVVGHYLGLNKPSAFHLNTACSSFLDGLGIAYLLIKSGEYKRIIVIGADLMSRYLDFGDVTTAILFGDGASAAILEKSDETESGILSYSSMTQYNNEMLSMDYGKNIRMAGGPLVQRNAVNSMYTSLENALQKASLQISDVKYLIPHQANLRILQRLADKMKIPHSSMVQSVTFTGNTSGASIGIGLDLAFYNRFPDIRFEKGDLIGLTTVGGGYTFSGMAYRI